MVYRHVIWDWNGTLLDDAWLCREVINGLLRQRGLPPVDAQRYGSIFGFPLSDYCRRLGFDLTRESYEILSDAFSAVYEARRHQCGLRAGARQVLARIGAAGVPQSILSAYEHETLNALVQEYDLTPHFVAVVGVTNPYGNGKVDRGREHLRHLGLPPSRVLLVGDTLHDLEVAQAAGVDCILVPSGHQHAERLRRGGAHVVEALADVAAAVAAGPGKHG